MKKNPLWTLTLALLFSLSGLLMACGEAEYMEDEVSVPARVTSEPWPPASAEEAYQMARNTREIARHEEGYDRRYSLERALELYLQAAAELEVADEVNQVADLLLEEDPADMTVLNLLLQAWEGGVDPDVLTTTLARMRGAYLARVHEAGFRLDNRYRREDITPEEDLYWCGSLPEDIWAVFQISNLLQPADPETDRWRLHRADMLVTPRYCEGGTIAATDEDFGEIYDDYLGLGYPGDAKIVAEQAADLYLRRYALGYWTESDGCYYDSGDPGLLPLARTWLKRLPPAEQEQLLRDYAVEAERAGQWAQARVLYQELGDGNSADRMSVMAECNDCILPAGSQVLCSGELLAHVGS